MQGSWLVRVLAAWKSCVSWQGAVPQRAQDCGQGDTWVGRRLSAARNHIYPAICFLFNENEEGGCFARWKSKEMMESSEFYFYNSGAINNCESLADTVCYHPTSAAAWLNTDRLPLLGIRFIGS